MRPSRRTLEAAEAARADVTLLGALRCESVLPTAAFELRPVDPPLIVLDAAVAAVLPVTFDFAITDSLVDVSD